MNRVTDKHIEAQVSIINRMLGYGEHPAYSTVGAVTLYSAYGSTGVQQYSNEHGGVRTLFNLDTKRAVSYFLSGMIASLRILDTADKN